METVEKQQTQTIDFGSLKVIEVPMILGGDNYVLCEADGNAGCAYRNALLSSADLTFEGTKGKVGKVHNLASVEPLLVSMCLFKVGSDGTRKPVPEKVIRTWPARIVKKLYDKAKEISELDETKEEEIPTPADEPKSTEED